MAQHKWHKEIKAWADGAEIEYILADESYKDHWIPSSDPSWNIEHYLFRIKPQPKEPQYLYAYFLMQKPEVFLFDRPQIMQRGDKFLGKIKLEVEE